MYQDTLQSSVNAQTDLFAQPPSVNMETAFWTRGPTYLDSISSRAVGLLDQLYSPSGEAPSDFVGLPDSFSETGLLLNGSGDNSFPMLEHPYSRVPCAQGTPAFPTLPSTVGTGGISWVSGPECTNFYPGLTQVEAMWWKVQTAGATGLSARLNQDPTVKPSPETLAISAITPPRWLRPPLPPTPPAPFMLDIPNVGNTSVMPTEPVQRAILTPPPVRPPTQKASARQKPKKASKLSANPKSLPRNIHEVSFILIILLQAGRPLSSADIGRVIRAIDRSLDLGWVEYRRSQIKGGRLRESIQQCLAKNSKGKPSPTSGLEVPPFFTHIVGKPYTAQQYSGQQHVLDSKKHGQTAARNSPGRGTWAVNHGASGRPQYRIASGYRLPFSIPDFVARLGMQDKVLDIDDPDEDDRKEEKRQEGQGQRQETNEDKAEETSDCLWTKLFNGEDIFA